MNRILLEMQEIGHDGTATLCDKRATHINRVLKPKEGSTIRIGILNGPFGTAQILNSTETTVTLTCQLEDTQPQKPQIDLLLALPRPKVMRRLWAQLASLGIHHIMLTNAEKVERNYFATHWLNPETYKPRLIEGLQQSGDTHLPQVSIHRNFKRLIERELPHITQNNQRIVCHPQASNEINQLTLKKEDSVLLAIGPEGGWTENEINLLTQHNFHPHSFGWRILRSDVACTALISAINTLTKP